MKEQIENLMRSLGVSEQEAISILEMDKEIDRGAKLFSLDPEAEKEAKKARQVERKKPTVFDSTKKKKPENASKQNLIEIMRGSLEENGASEIAVANPEREFSFVFEGVHYKVVMSVPRK